MNKPDLNQILRENIIQKRFTSIIIKPDGTNMFYSYDREQLLSKEPDEDLINKLSPNPQYRYVYRWKNGRVGAIFPNENRCLLDFREYKLYDGPDNTTSYPDGLRPVKEGDEECDECKELLAVGIVAYYLNMRNAKNPKEIFADYLDDAIKIFYFCRDAEMKAWNPKYKNEFSYSEHFKRESINIRNSSRIFEFLSKTEVIEIKTMAANYLQFVKSRITRINCRDLSREEEKDCFKKAVLRVMNMKNDQGNYIFHKNTQWIAIYCYAVDYLYLLDEKDDLEAPRAPATTQCKAFDRFIQELQLDLESTIRIPFKHDIDLSKKTYERYRMPYPWSKEGLEGKSLTLYKELEEVYIKLGEECRAIEEDISITLT